MHGFRQIVLPVLKYLYNSLFKYLPMKTLIAFLCLFFFSQSLFAARVDTISIQSRSMGKTLKAAVVLPDSYSRSKSSYPVVYLLHGAYGYFGDWLRKTPEKGLLQRLADQYNLIIVNPEGEKFSFYLDSPVNPKSQFETHLTTEVVEMVDRQYRTIRSKAGRAITGLSMGGHGALYLSARHPELYAAAGSMSGAVDMASLLSRENVDAIKSLLEPVFGAQTSDVALYDKHSVLTHLRQIKDNKMPLIIDCGTEDYLLEPNRELHRRLLYLKVPHEYTERPGAHTWEYWGDSLPYHILFFSEVFKKNGSAVK